MIQTFPQHSLPEATNFPKLQTLQISLHQTQLLDGCISEDSMAKYGNTGKYYTCTALYT